MFDATKTQTPHQPKRLDSTGWRWGQLILCVGVVVAVWGFVLPWLRQVPAVNRHVTTLSEANINADAMFYTELEWQAPPGAVWR